MKQIPLKCGKRVTDSSQAVIYISPDFVELATFLACNASDTAYYESMPSAYAADFFIIPCLSPYFCWRVLARQK